MNSQDTIRNLAQQAAQGNVDAFQSLYLETRQRAYFTALSITKNEADAQDILQDSYLKAYQCLDQLENPALFVPWLNRIVANKAKNYIARIRPGSFAEYGDENAVDWQEETDAEFLPDQRLDQQEAKELVLRLVDELPEDQRLVVLLRYYNDMEVAEVAKALDIPVGTVKSRLSRARQKLAAALQAAQDKGIRLYSLVPVPFLAYFIKLIGFEERAANRLPPLLLGTAASGGAGTAIAAATGKTTATKAAAGAAKAGKAASMPLKAAAVAAAGVVAVSGAIAGATVFNRNRAIPTIEAATTATERPGTSALLFWDDSPNPVVATEPPATIPALPSASPVLAPPSVGATTTTSAATTKTTKAATTATTTTTKATTTAKAAVTIPPWPTWPSAAPTTAPATTVTTTATTTTTTTSTTLPAPMTTTAPTTTEPQNPPSYVEFLFNPHTCTLEKYVGTATEVHIPREIDGTIVRHLGAGAFKGANVIFVEIASGIDCIREETFADCVRLREIVIPPTVVRFWETAFNGCPQDMVIVCKEGSEAHKWAARRNIAVRFATQFN
jgi:RNA polymerase sigma factor (sigma-70 family)